jgi:hypothetical protein
LTLSIRTTIAILAVAAAGGLGAPGASAQSPAQGPGGPVLVVTGPDLNPTVSGQSFGSYYAEILRAEGLNEFTVTDTGALNPGTLAGYQVVLLASTAVAPAQRDALSAWVQAGGNLIAMRPDAGLAPLLGLGADTGDLTDSYLKVATGSPPGAGIAGDTMQFHGTADRWSSAGAATVATLYSDANTPTSAPAVTLRSVGSAGGQAAAFTYDLARSVVYTRQGNPQAAGLELDGNTDAIRSDDLFSPFPDWLDLGKVAIPQADEQQRLLANLITQMNLDRTPLPRFWYLPSGKKAAVVLTGDDHNHGAGGTRGQFNTYEADSPSGCSVSAWECVRSTSYLFPAAQLTNAEVANYQSLGFEIALHLWSSGTSGGAQNSGDETCHNFPLSGAVDAIGGDLGKQLTQFGQAFPSADAPVTNRNHCIVWSGWANVPKAELANHIRFDTNYYYWPASFVNNQPGMFTGSGFPMRFADTDGSLIDVYQATTQITDESGMVVDDHIKALLNGALNDGYYGVFTANMHTDMPDHPGADDIVAAAQARGVPVVSAKQMLTWLDGRNGSSFQGVSFGGGLLRFSVARASGALGLQTMVPAFSTAGELTQLTRNGAPVSATRRTVKGIDYATFDSSSGDYVAAYGGATIPLDTAGAASSAAGAGQTPASGATRDRKAPRVTIVKRTVRASKKGLVTLRVACPKGEIRCRVDLRLRLGLRLLVRKSLTVAGGKSANVTLKLLRTDRLRLVRVRSLLVSASAAARDVAGNHATTTTRIRLLAPARR